MGYGKTIELFLADGTNNGIVTAELSNWSGKAIKIPRIDIKHSTKETVSEYNTNGEKIYEKNTVKLVQPDPTWGEELSEEDKQTIREIPNFDAEIFEEITGIKEEK
jgi:hypothetical protein